MFVRKKKNRSGSISVQVISKEGGQYKVFKTMGSSSDLGEIETLVERAKALVRKPSELQDELFPLESRSDRLIRSFIGTLSNSSIHTLGPELIFGTLFDRIGFDVIPEELFRHLVIARLAYPTSKLKTVDYLRRYRGEEVSIDSVYRFLDTLQKDHKHQVERVAYEYTKQTLKTISVVFYDMTTLYFEAEDEDDLRKTGFSKDGKFQKPQILLGLLVGEHGYPIGYDIFQGNTFEGHTLLPVLNQMQRKYRFPKPVVIADAALLSKDNLDKLSQQKYRFIIGGRIKNESDAMKDEIHKRARGMRDGEGFSIRRADGLRLVVTYSDSRAKKDAYNRDRGLRKLRKRVRSGRLTKEHINNRGYNKFLTLRGEIQVKIDESKIEQDKRWDGLKGYITNTRLWPRTIVESYRHLWQIEKAFRISKTDLRVRPIYHYRRRRIEAHICIAFVAYTIYKELERLLYKHDVGSSAKRAAELTHNMYELECMLPDKENLLKTLLKMDDEQRRLYEVIHKNELR